MHKINDNMYNITEKCKMSVTNFLRKKLVC